MWTPSCPIVLFIPNSIIAPKNRHIPQKPRFHAYLSHRWGRSNLNSTMFKESFFECKNLSSERRFGGSVHHYQIRGEPVTSHQCQILSVEPLRSGRLQGGPREIGFQRYPLAKLRSNCNKEKNRLLGCNHQHHLLSQMDAGSIPCELNHF